MLTSWTVFCLWMKSEALRIDIGTNMQLQRIHAPFLTDLLECAHAGAVILSAPLLTNLTLNYASPTVGVKSGVVSEECCSSYKMAQMHPEFAI
jgi:hypothetical protein